MNGLMGWIEDLDPLTFRFDGEEAARAITPEATADLMSAWAITGHRAQGSEAKRVIVALDVSNILTREWIYTAITRATEQVVLIGSKDTMTAALARRSTRQTGFPTELTHLRTFRSQE
jgi:exodeoxyribonuclease V alpha subunit